MLADENKVASNADTLNTMILRIEADQKHPFGKNLVIVGGKKTKNQKN
jgi:hypothetical protein